MYIFMSIAYIYIYFWKSYRLIRVYIFIYIYKVGFGGQFWHTAYGLMDSSWISGWLWWWVFGFGGIWWQLNSIKQLVWPGMVIPRQLILESCNLAGRHGISTIFDSRDFDGDSHGLCLFVFRGLNPLPWSGVATQHSYQIINNSFNLLKPLTSKVALKVQFSDPSSDPHCATASAATSGDVVQTCWIVGRTNRPRKMTWMGHLLGKGQGQW